MAHFNAFESLRARAKTPRINFECFEGARITWDDSYAARNPAFQSKLEPYREFIRECRAKRWSYPRIARFYREITALSVCSEHHLFLRQSSRQAAQALCAAALGRIASFPTHPATPKARDFFTSPSTKGTP